MTWKKLTESKGCSVCRFKLNGCSYALCPGVRVPVASANVESQLQQERGASFESVSPERGHGGPV